MELDLNFSFKRLPSSSFSYPRRGKKESFCYSWKFFGEVKENPPFEIGFKRFDTFAWLIIKGKWENEKVFLDILPHNLCRRSRRRRRPVCDTFSSSFISLVCMCKEGSDDDNNNNNRKIKLFIRPSLFFARYPYLKFFEVKNRLKSL